MKAKLFLVFYLFVFLFFCNGCKKYLDKSPNKALAIPSTVSDYQALLDNENMFVKGIALGDFGSDDYYLSYSTWQSLFYIMRNAYNWNGDIFDGQTNDDWNSAYQVVYTSNIVLDGLKKIQVSSSNEIAYNTAKGTALFYRAFSTYNIEETFGEPFKASSADSDLGVPLRLTSNLNETSKRETVRKVFNQIIEDLVASIDLLPSNVQLSTRNRPTKPAAYGLLARVYLTMQDYVKAEEFAEKCLNVYSALIDYNSSSFPVNANRSFPSAPNENAEVIFECYQLNYGTFVANATTNIDSNLYRSYDVNDLRKTLFFRSNPFPNTYSFRGQYSGSSFTFGGIATDEIYLIRAECKARRGDVQGSLTDLNMLIKKRWKNTVPYTNITAVDQANALQKVLIERRKELIFRGLRWSDLRRLNQDPNYAITLQRNLNGQIITLQPNDKKYTYPIPPDEILMSGFMQNER